MALPQQITTTYNSFGEFKSSGGNFYVACGTGTFAISVYKNTNPGTASWAAQDDSNRPTNGGVTPLRVAAVQIGDILHFVHFDATATIIYYSRFDMSSDSWNLTDNQVADVSGMTAPTIFTCAIAAKDTSSVVIAANGLQDADMGTNYNRLDIWVSSATGTPSWTGPTSLDATVAANNEQSPLSVQGINSTSDVHLGWFRNTGSSLTVFAARTFRSDSTLSTLQQITGDSFYTPVNTRNDAVSYNDSGTGRTIFLVRRNTSDVASIYTTEDGSGDLNTLSITNINDSAAARAIALAESGGTLYALWAESGTNDLTLDISSNGGGTWGTDSVIKTTPNFSLLYSASILETGIIAFTYRDTNLYYDEYTLSSDVNVNTNLETLVLTEQQATITLDVNISANTESLVLTEQPATIELFININANTESLVLTEQPATITLDVNVNANTESLILTEQQATISLDVDVAANTETLVLTENPATIVIDTNVLANTESLVLTGQTASIVYDVNVNANTETLVLTPNTASIDFGVNVLANTETLVLTGQTAAITLDVNVLANTESLLLTEQAASIVYDVNVLANTETLVLTPQTATISTGVNVLANTETLVLTGNQASITLDVNVNANTESLLLTEQAATVSHDINVLANVESLTLTEQTADIIYDVNVLANVASLTLTGQTANIILDVDVQANLETLVLTGFPATITTTGDINVLANTEQLFLTGQQASILFVPVGGLTFNTVCEWTFSKAGYTGTYQDRLWKILEDKGYTAQKQLDDKFYAYLDANGYTGNMSDKITKAAFIDGWLWQQ